MLHPLRTVKTSNSDCEDIGDFIGVYRGALAASAKCDDTPASDIGPQPPDIANWWHKEPGLVTTPPKPVTVGELSPFLSALRGPRSPTAWGLDGQPGSTS